MNENNKKTFEFIKRFNEQTVAEHALKLAEDLERYAASLRARVSGKYEISSELQFIKATLAQHTTEIEHAEMSLKIRHEIERAIEDK